MSNLLIDCIFLQNANDHGSPQFPNLLYLYSHVWVVSRCLFHDFKFIIYLLLYWLPYKSIEHSLPCYLFRHPRSQTNHSTVVFWCIIHVELKGFIFCQRKKKKSQKSITIFLSYMKWCTLQELNKTLLKR